MSEPWAELRERVGRERVVYCDEHVILLHARWQDVVASLPQVDAVITDPPYGERTHGGQRHGRKDPRYTASDSTLLSARGLAYEHWTIGDVRSLVALCGALCPDGWLACMTSHDLCAAYETAYREANRYAFAPLACTQLYRNVRLAGDGPSSWTDYLMVGRPRTMKAWGALPGAYVGKPFDDGQNMLDRSKRVTGGKPLWLMRDIVRDYSRAGDLILDPCCGGGTTGRAARQLGRRCILVDQDRDTCEHAAVALLPNHQVEMFAASEGATR